MDDEATKERSLEESSEVPHEVCGFTGVSAARAVSSLKDQARAKKQEAPAAGDVSMGAADATGAISGGAKATRWKSVILLTLLVYAASLGIALLLADAAGWARVFFIPLFPVLCAGAAFGWRQKWKLRAMDGEFRLRIWQEALDSVSRETVNTVNAMRAQLIGFRLANPGVAFAEHLDSIQEATLRVNTMVQNARDPMKWHLAKKKRKVKEEAAPSQEGESPRGGAG